MNRTQKLLGPPICWTQAFLELEDKPSRRSGRRIVVYGSGHAVVQLVSADWQEQRYEFRLDRPAAQQLFQLTIDHDLATFEPAVWPGQPEETIIRIRFCWDGRHMDRRTHKVASSVEPRFDAIYQALLNLEDRSHDLTPTYTGRHVSYYKPRQGLATLPARLYRFVDNLKYFELRDLGRFLADLILVLFQIWPLLLLAAVLLVAAYFWGEIDPTRTYGFGNGLRHGFFWIQNSILAIFTGRPIMAPLHIGLWYQVGFFMGAIVIPFIIKTTVEVVVMIIKR